MSQRCCWCKEIVFEIFLRAEVYVQDMRYVRWMFFLIHFPYVHSTDSEYFHKIYAYIAGSFYSIWVTTLQWWNICIFLNLDLCFYEPQTKMLPVLIRFLVIFCSICTFTILRPRQNSRHFAEDIILNKKLCLIQIYQKFVREDLIWNEPLSELMMTYLTDVYMRQSALMG